MNGPPFSEFDENARREFSENKMDQIREILVGDIERRLDSQVRQLEQRMSEIEVGIIRQIDDLERRLEQLSGEASDHRRSMLDDLANSISELGERVRKISRD